MKRKDNIVTENPILDTKSRQLLPITKKKRTSSVCVTVNPEEPLTKREPKVDDANRTCGFMNIHVLS